MTRGDGLRERTARVAGEEPHKPKRNAKRSSQKGEQTERADHPVDGSLERLCGRLSLHVDRVALR